MCYVLCVRRNADSVTDVFTAACPLCPSTTLNIGNKKHVRSRISEHLRVKHNSGTARRRVVVECFVESLFFFRFRFLSFVFVMATHAAAHRHQRISEANRSEASHVGRVRRSRHAGDACQHSAAHVAPDDWLSRWSLECRASSRRAARGQ